MVLLKKITWSCIKWHLGFITSSILALSITKSVLSGQTRKIFLDLLKRGERITHLEVYNGQPILVLFPLFENKHIIKEMDGVTPQSTQCFAKPIKRAGQTIYFKVNGMEGHPNKIHNFVNPMPYKINPALSPTKRIHMAHRDVPYPFHKMLIKCHFHIHSWIELTQANVLEINK